MNRKSWLLAAVVLVVASVPLFTSWIPLSQFPAPLLKTYPGNHAFFHDTGMHSAYGWDAHYRHHRPGYMVRGLLNGGEKLAEGVFRFDFYFALRPGHLTSIISGANDVVRLEVVDATTKEILIQKTFQLADFGTSQKKLIPKSLTFSTLGRGGHQFEPRIYWQGLSGLFLQRVELATLGNVSMVELKQKAVEFEDLMPRLFLDRGYVVLRDAANGPADIGDSAIWTGLYVAAQALRYQTTQDAPTLKRLEKSLWALHDLVQKSSLEGTMVRYVEADGKILTQPASKDTYTGFFYGVAQAFPYIRDPALRKALLNDTESLAGHFLEHDLSFTSPHGASVDMNPYPSPKFVAEAMQDLQRKRSLRRDLIRTLRFARWYFWIHGQRPPSSFARLIKVLKKPSATQFDKEFLPFLNDLRLALQKVQKNVHRSALRGPRQGLTDTPFIKLDLLLLRVLGNLDANTDGKPLSSISDLKVLPSQSLHALHFLKVAGQILPKPNRFETYYQANLFEGKALLRTAIQWHQIDEEALNAVLGQTEVDTRRTSSSHLSFLALHDLILLEKDPIIRFKYQKLFEQQYQPMRTDGNAMIDAMHAAVGLSTKQLGLALWSLQRYPVDRRGKGDVYWRENKRSLAAAFGGEVNGQAREPLPPDLRPRDAFLWQRSAHSLRGDHEGWLYPPLDYLFAYWLAINSANLPAVTEKS